MYISCYQCVLGEIWCLSVVYVISKCILCVLSVVECFVECFGVFEGVLSECECVLSLLWVF